MAINTTHPDYDASGLDWARARDVLAGEDAVKTAAVDEAQQLKAGETAKVIANMPSLVVHS